MTETEKVRSFKEVSSARRYNSKRYPVSTPDSTEERQSEVATRSAAQSNRQRRSRRVAPDAQGRMSSRTSKKTTNGGTESSTRKSRRSSKKSLQVDTQQDADADGTQTPETAAATPDGSATPAGTRGSKDLRSPGQRKTPGAQNLKVASEGDPLPDLMTQTDKFGKAVTPRNSKSIEEARSLHPGGPKPHLHVGKDGKLHEEDSGFGLDACTETLYDSLRLMCCCLAPEDAEISKAQASTRDDEEQEAYESRPRLLPCIHPDDHGKKCLVLDLDETLVHSSFRAVPGADFVIPVQIEDVVHFVYVAKRPGVDEFLIEMAKHYEIIIYTASLNKYADPLLDLLDPQRTIRTRLFRESCVYYEGNYVKDLSLLDRDLSQAIIIDNSPSSYVFHPENAIDCSSFIEDPRDRELDQIADFLIGIKDTRDVRGIAPQWREWPNVKVDNQ